MKWPIISHLFSYVLVFIDSHSQIKVSDLFEFQLMRKQRLEMSRNMFACQKEPTQPQAESYVKDINNLASSWLQVRPIFLPGHIALVFRVSPLFLQEGFSIFVIISYIEKLVFKIIVRCACYIELLSISGQWIH